MDGLILKDPFFSDMTPTSKKLCEECDMEDSSLYCVNCEALYCQLCFYSVHDAKVLKSHKSINNPKLYAIKKAREEAQSIRERILSESEKGPTARESLVGFPSKAPMDLEDGRERGHSLAEQKNYLKQQIEVLRRAYRFVSDLEKRQKSEIEQWDNDHIVVKQKIGMIQTLQEKLSEKVEALLSTAEDFKRETISDIAKSHKHVRKCSSYIKKALHDAEECLLLSDEEQLQQATQPLEALIEDCMKRVEDIKANGVQSIDGQISFDQYVEEIEEMTRIVDRFARMRVRRKCEDLYDQGMILIGEGKETEGVNLICQSASQNCLFALEEMSRLQMKGIGCEKNPEKSFEWALKASSFEDASGDVLAYAGKMINRGIGAHSADPENAVVLLKRAVSKGNADAIVFLALDIDSKYLEENESLKFLERAANAGNADAQLKYGNHLIQEKRPKEAVEFFQRAAEQEHLDALFQMGRCYHYGLGVEQDFKNAASYYYRAAKMGHIEGQFNLAFLYETGNGVEQHLEYALEWYKNAAEQGDASSQCRAAFIYEKGMGAVPKNELEALRYYRMAAERGDAYSQYKVAEYLQKGNVVDENKEAAVKWYAKSAAQGFDHAMCSLSVCLRNGYGCQRNLDEAFLWAKRAAENGFVQGEFLLGKMFMDGLGVESDLGTGLSYLRKAADQGHVEALMLLSQSQKQGFFVSSS